MEGFMALGMYLFGRCAAYEFRYAIGLPVYNTSPQYHTMITYIGMYLGRCSAANGSTFAVYQG